MASGRERMFRVVWQAVGTELVALEEGMRDEMQRLEEASHITPDSKS